MAVSINVDRILKLPGVPERALETVLMLLAVVLVSIVGLIPGQGTVALGAELLGVALVLGGVIGGLAARSVPRAQVPRSWVAMRLLLLAAGTVPLLLGGASVLSEAGGGLYWIAAGIVFGIAGAVSNAWVLLIGILR